MAIGTIFVYHGVETGTTDELRLINLEVKSFSHEVGAISQKIVKRGEKNLPFTENGRDSWYVTFYLVVGDNLLSSDLSLDDFNTEAVLAVQEAYPDAEIGIV